MTTKRDIIVALGELRDAAAEAQHKLAMHEPQAGDPPEVELSKADAWARDYEQTMQPIKKVLNYLNQLDARNHAKYVAFAAKLAKLDKKASTGG